MISVNTHEAKSKLSALLAKVEAGERVRICRNGKPVADLVPATPVRLSRSRLEKHPVLSKGKLHYDPTQPLDEGDWPDAFR